MVRRDTKEIVPHTKTDCGDRFVYLTEEAKRIIATAKERQRELRVNSEGYIFSLTDEPIPERCISSLLKKYCNKLGILHRSSHKIRKTYGSSLLEGGVSINTTRIMLGHSDEKTTLKYYCFDTHTEVIITKEPANPHKYWIAYAQKNTVPDAPMSSKTVLLSARSGVRTLDTLIKSQVLCQLS